MMRASAPRRIVLRVRFSYGPIGQEIGILVAATDRDGALTASSASPVGIGWEYADDRTNDGQSRDRGVDRVVARLFAARARQEAVALKMAYASSSYELRNRAPDGRAKR